MVDPHVRTPKIAVITSETLDKSAFEMAVAQSPQKNWL